MNFELKESIQKSILGIGFYLLWTAISAFSGGLIAVMCLVDHPLSFHRSFDMTIILAGYGLLCVLLLISFLFRELYKVQSMMNKSNGGSDVSGQAVTDEDSLQSSKANQYSLCQILYLATAGEDVDILSSFLHKVCNRNHHELMT